MPKPPFLLATAQMRRLSPHFPRSRGIPRVDDRRVLSGIIYVIRHGLQWRDAPPAYGPHKTLLDEFYRVAFRKKVYRAIEELQADLDEWMRHYNEARTHQGRWCFGKTPMQTFQDSRPIVREKQQIGEAA